MKIGFFGNANNYPFILARALKRRGHDVKFVIDGSERLNRPEFRHSDISFPYPDWIYDASPVRIRDLMLPSGKRSTILALLRECDFVILNGLGPSLYRDIGRPAFILLTGTDLEGYADLKNVESHARFHLGSWLPDWLWRHGYRTLISAQREGIRSAAGLTYFARGLIPNGDKLLDEIGVRESQRTFFLMTDLEFLSYVPPPNNQPIRVFCGTRLTWKRPVPFGGSELDFKGSDVMIKALAEFVRKTQVPLNIRLVKKGAHVQETMHLVNELGLDRHVTWLDGMTQREVWEESRQADIMFEQFGKSTVAMAGLDAMAIGRPLIANGRPEFLEPYFGTSPICQATTPEEACHHLDRLIADPAERERVGRASREYVAKYFSPDRAAEVCLEFFRRATSN